MPVFDVSGFQCLMLVRQPDKQQPVSFRSTIRTGLTKISTIGFEHTGTGTVVLVVNIDITIQSTCISPVII